MITFRLYLDKRRKKKDETYPIKLAVYNESDMMFSTGVSCKKENWNSNLSVISKSEPGYKAKNALLEMKVNRIRLLILSLEKDEIYNISDRKLKSHIEKTLKGENENRRTLLSVAREHISSCNKKNTILSYNQTIDKINNFDPGADINEITVRWLKDFHNSMDTLSLNSKAIHLRNLRAIINYAIDQEYTDNYPFRRYSIKTEETPKRSLTLEQLKMFKYFECEEYLKEYRDMFFLTIYLCGINFVDLAHLKEIKNGRIEYYRHKTNTFYSIKVEPEAMEIINRYRGKNYLINVLDRYKDYRSYNSRLNKMLKRFGSVKIGKHGKKTYSPLFEDISIYWARHTFATLAAEIDIPDDTISLALGHNTANETTAIYINRNLKKVDDANRKVIDAIIGKQSNEK